MTLTQPVLVSNTHPEKFKDIPWAVNGWQGQQILQGFRMLKEVPLHNCTLLIELHILATQSLCLKAASASALSPWLPLSCTCGKTASTGFLHGV